MYVFTKYNYTYLLAPRLKNTKTRSTPGLHRYALNLKQIIHTAVSAQASSTSEYFSVIFPPNKIFSRNVSENIQASCGETEILLERRTLPSVTSNSFSNTESNVL